MKIVRISNFNDESVAEVLVCDNVLDSESEVLIAALRINVGDNDRFWYTFKPDDYVLWRGMADLVGD